MIEVLTKFLKLYIMLKNILKLEGTQKLTRGEQKSINGGGAPICENGYKAKKCYIGGVHWECVSSDFNGSC